jgi:hypothetical protein
MQQYGDKVTGILSGFDRLIFRGYLRELSYVGGLFMYLCWRKVRLTEFGRFAQTLTEKVKAASVAEAQRLERPIVYLPSSRADKDATAKALAAEHSITDGLVCVLSSVEPCRSFDVGCNPRTNRFELLPRRRKCLFLYHYYVDPVFGFMHARIQTWMPFDVQIYVNGREWLARQMDAVGLRYERRDNCFVSLQDVSRAQELMNEQLKLDWPRELERIALAINPQRCELLDSERIAYYWTVFQSEWASDLMFRSPAALAGIYPRLVRHGITAFSSGDVIRFLGGKVHGRFRGEIVSDFKNRPEGIRIKHRVRSNSVKLYDKQGSVLRTETTVNEPEELKVFRPKEGDPGGKRAWLPMRRGIADLHRRAEVSQASNERYIEAIAAADTTQPLGELLANIERPLTWQRRRVRGLRAWSKHDLALFRAVNRGEFCLNGFRNRDLRLQLFGDDPADRAETRRRAARVSRLIRMLRAHRIVHKLPRTHRYRISPIGRRVLTAILCAHEASLSELNSLAAAA